MKRHSEKGMALVITLMMLAIVTFMAVVFLSLSRRERANVKISEEQTTSRLVADAALERAKADLTAGMNNAVENFLGQATNALIFGKAIDQQHVAAANGAVQRGLFAYDLRTSRNFINPNGFKPADGAAPWNVSYVDKKGVPLDPTSDNYYQAVANLQYDPRVPVIVTEGKTNDFRYYLDLNRNGMFDQNDLFEVIRYGNTAFGTPFYVTNRYSGDPEWIGVLERPDLPHSETNRFIGRYAYIMMPTGKSLDINFIHNMAVYDQTDLKFDGSKRRYSRNQGVGSWELNLAAFLVDLNTNVWKPNTTFYNLNTNLATGVAFKDAVGLLQYRFNNSQTNFYTPKEVFGATNRWAADFVDMNSDGPIIPYQFMYYSARPNFDLQTTTFRLENDRDDRYWHGADRAALTGEFADVQRYFINFKTNKPGVSAEQLGFYGRFIDAVASPRTNIYDRFAYYRMLSQMGADSRPALQNKIHLNFVNEPGTISTNLLPWVTNSTFGAMPTAIIRSNTAVAVTRKDGGQEFVAQPNNLTNFFLIAANAMLRESLVTNVFIDDFGKWRTNYTIGCSYFHDPSLNTVWQDPTRRRYIVGTPVRPDISITNIQIYHKTNVLSTWRPNDQTYTNAEYTAAVHRILQLAANIYDSMTNNAGRTGKPQVAGSQFDSPSDPYFPTVFRPIYAATETNLLIVGWQSEQTADFAINATTSTNLFFSPARYFENLRGQATTNIPVSFYGQPWVIGAKKGWPNFNEFSIETFAQITRKLEVLKDKAGQQVDTNNLQYLADHTRQVYMVGFSNTFGLEAWNSYVRTNQRSMRLIAEVQADFGVERVTQRDTNGNVLASVNVPIPIPLQLRRFTNSMTSGNWPGRKGDMALSNAFPNLPTGNGGSDFRVPIYQTAPVLPDSEYSDQPLPRFYKTNAVFQTLKETPDLRFNVTNRVRFLMVDIKENRVIDYVTFDNLLTTIDLDKALKGEQTYGNLIAGADGNLDPKIYWNTLPESKTGTPKELTQGIMSQIESGLGILMPPQAYWKNYSAYDTTSTQVKEFVDYMNGVNTNSTVATNVTRQVPFSPTRTFHMITPYQANDPFVHYTIEDLRNAAITTRPIPFTTLTGAKNDELGKRNTRRQAIRTDGLHGVEFQDPRIFESDDWQFPIAKLDDPSVHTAYGAPNFNYRFPNIGALGQIHRGTPWQTFYLKAMAAPNVDPRTVTTNVAVWANWAGSYATHPTNDWKLVGLFTTAMSENAARGLLSVNQSGIAAWSAVLSGVPVITNSLSDNKAKMSLPPEFGDPKNQHQDLLIQPGSVQLSNIVRSINQYRAYRPMGVFSYLGEVLGAPALSYGLSPDPTRQVLQASPYLHISDAQVKTQDGKVDWHEFTDDALEAIPQRILSLLKEDEPRVTIYCFGQTLKPAPRSYVTSADFYNLCVNYQVTGEYVTKAVVRVEGEFKNPANPLRTVVESFEVLAPFE